MRKRLSKIGSARSRGEDKIRSERRRKTKVKDNSFNDVIFQVHFKLLVETTDSVLGNFKILRDII